MSVLAIIVTYYPNQQSLRGLVNSLCSQADAVLIVDNTPAQDDRVFIFLKKDITENLYIVRLGENLGIATALNFGIDIAILERFSHTLLSDQDSMPNDDMVSGLLKAELEISATGVKVAAVGPIYVDDILGVSLPFQVQKPGRLFYSSEYVNEEKPNLSTLFLITSGTLIKCEALESIGNMREDFFIDHVDVEWCHRAIAKGYMIIGTAYAKMRHHMGDKCLKFWLFGWHTTNGYNPIRLYYRYRNFTYLFHLPYISIYWKIRASLYWLKVLYAHLLFSSNRIVNLKSIFIGFLHGLIGKMGKWDIQ